MNDSYLLQINLKKVLGFEEQSRDYESPLKTTAFLNLLIN